MPSGAFFIASTSDFFYNIRVLLVHKKQPFRDCGNSQKTRRTIYLYSTPIIYREICFSAWGAENCGGVRTPLFLCLKIRAGCLRRFAFRFAFGVNVLHFPLNVVKIPLNWNFRYLAIKKGKQPIIAVSPKMPAAGLEPAHITPFRLCFKPFLYFCFARFFANLSKVYVKLIEHFKRLLCLSRLFQVNNIIINAVHCVRATPAAPILDIAGTHNS